MGQILFVSFDDLDSVYQVWELENSMDIEVDMAHPQRVYAVGIEPHYDVILFDDDSCHADTMRFSSLEVCTVIRIHTDKPLLLLTGNSSEQAAIRAYGQGVDEVIGKPIRNDLLAAKINSWLRWSRLL